MAVAIQQISPVAHLPLVLGVVRKLNVAALIDTFCPPHPANVLSCSRGVEALLLSILDGDHALYKVLGCCDLEQSDRSSGYHATLLGE